MGDSDPNSRAIGSDGLLTLSPEFTGADSDPKEIGSLSPF